MPKFFFIIITFFSLPAIIHPANAVVIESFNAGTIALSSAYIGQSFTTGSNVDTLTNLTFSWLSPFGGEETKVASGRIYLLDQQYFGAPNNLSVNTPGYVTKSLLTTSEYYAFDPNLTLNNQTLYWAYMDGTAQVIGGGAALGDIYSGGSYSQPPVFTDPDFEYGLRTDVDANFLIESGAFIIPEPTTLSLASLILLIGLTRRRING